MYEEDYGEEYDIDDEEEGEDDIDDEEEDYDIDEVDHMLEALMAEDEADLADRLRRRKRRHRRSVRGPVRKARGLSAYRAPLSRRYVTQKQLKDALGRVGRENRRNAQGIKTINARVGRLDSRVNGVVSVNRVQSRQISKLDKTIKLDGALEFAESYDGTSINVYQLFKGAVKSGMLGGTKGALSNPLLIGGIGLLLNNPQILSGLAGGNLAGGGEGG